MCSALRTQDLRDALAQVAHSVAIVGVEDGEWIRGATITSFMGISMEPAIVVLSLHRESSLVERIVQRRDFGVTVLSGPQDPIARSMARRDRPALCPNELGPGRVPRVAGGSAFFHLRLRERLCVGDHHLLLTDVVACEAGSAAPLVYQQRAYRELAMPTPQARPIRTA